VEITQNPNATWNVAYQPCLSNEMAQLLDEFGATSVLDDVRIACCEV